MQNALRQKKREKKSRKTQMQHFSVGTGLYAYSNHVGSWRRMNEVSAFQNQKKGKQMIKLGGKSKRLDFL